MDYKAFFLAGVLILLTLNGQAIASCATESFRNACKYCSFDEEGRVDKDCQGSYESKGKTCTIKAYPKATAKYLSGYLIGDGCPALEACVNKLKSCTSISCPDKAKQNCVNPVCLSCYHEADRCAYRASEDCAGKAECGDGKCEISLGEDETVCCRDCGCVEGYECVRNGCVEKKAEVIDDTPDLDEVYDFDGEPTFVEFCFGFLALPLASLASILGYRGLV